MKYTKCRVFWIDFLHEMQSFSEAQAKKCGVEASLSLGICLGTSRVTKTTMDAVGDRVSGGGAIGSNSAGCW